MSVSFSPRTKMERVPRLDIRAPVLLDLSIAVLFFGAGVGGASIAPLDKGVRLPGQFIVETKVKPIQHERGGRVSKIHISEGQKVAAGDLLVTFDATSLVEQIEALEAQARAANRQLDLASQEAATMHGLLEKQLTQRSRVLAVEREVAQIEKEVASINARVAVAKRELEHTEVRSPVSGRILTLKVNGAGAVVEPGGTLMEVVPASDRIVVEGRLSPDSVDSVMNGMPAKVWLPALGWRDQRPVKAQLSWVSPDSIEDRRTGTRYFTARVVIAEEAAADLAEKVNLLPGMRAEVLLITGRRTLLDQLVDPLLRNMNRAFRD